MTLIETIPTQHLPSQQRQHIRVAWSCLPNLSALIDQTPDSQARTFIRTTILLHVDMLSEEFASVRLTIAQDDSERTLRSFDRSSYEFIVRDGMASLDVTSNDLRLLSLTIDDQGRLLYAQSDLLPAVGLTGGTYDPPQLLQASLGRNAVSA